MFKNVLKISLRVLKKNKASSLINMIGLSIGTFCCLYILLYVRDQYSYDRSFRDFRDMYRVVSQVGESRSGAPRIQATTTPPVAPALATDFPDMLTSTRVAPTRGAEQHLLRYKNEEVYENEAYLVDINFFKLFDFHFSAGDANQALDVANGIVLSKRVADKLFGKEDPLGKSVFIQDGYGEGHFEVTGVVDESIGKSSIRAGLFLRMSPEAFHFLSDSSWQDHDFIYTFVKLKPGQSAKELEQKLPGFIINHTHGLSVQSGAPRALHLQPISDIHTTGGYESEMGKTVSRFFLGVLLSIALMIQLIACINFMNLATARASKRAKEVGVRKVIGAGKKGLVFQFLIESFLLSLLAVLIAMPLLAYCLPWLNELTGADIQRSLFTDPEVWGILAIIAILTGLLAGSYPAFYLAGFQTTNVLKGDFTNQASAAGLRRYLVVFQFVLSIILISAIVIIRKQLDYIQSKDLGFSKNEQIVFNFYNYATKKCAVYFSLGLRALPEVSEVCQTDNYPGGLHYTDEHIYVPRGGTGNTIAVQALSSDEHFAKTLGIPLVSGRDFEPHDSGSVLINQTLAEDLGLDITKAPGTTLSSVSGAMYRIVGVLKDFNYQSLHDQISPFMLIYKSNRFDFSHLVVRASSTNYGPLLEKMESLWKTRVFMAPFEFSFLSDDVRKMYETEMIMSRIINSFTVIAVLISCLGLFGLAAFNAEQRTKEIGIRKIVGASTLRIVGLLSSEFFTLVSLSFLVAVPITWWMMDKWLNIFAYRIRITWWMFALSGGAAITIAMIVVCFQTIKAAVANPVKSLRT